MLILFWIFIFAISLAVLVKSADWLLISAEKIGLAAGLSPFIVGITIVGMGTSLPELISSLIATLNNVPEIVAANAIGSNIANILLIVGIAALISRKLTVTKDLIDLDLPLLAITTILFAGTAWDGKIYFIESLILLGAYIIYLLYSVLYQEEKLKTIKRQKPKLALKDFLLLILGILGLALSAKYLIDSTIKLSEILSIGVGALSLFAIALGTSLPELIVSAKAALQQKSDVALGNIFGSNIFNILVVIGIPGLFKTLPLDSATFTLGLPVLLVTTFLFIISGISKRIHIWEGLLYLVLYIFFIGKLFNFL